MSDNVTKTVCDYMLKQNRPYSAIDVWNNLRQEFPKPQIIKSLDAGVETGVLREKVISKQKIYFANQDLLEKSDENEQTKMDREIEEKTAVLNDRQSDLKTKKNELKQYESSLTMEEMQNSLITIHAEIAELKKIHEKMQQNEGTISDEKKEELMRKEKSYKSELRKRKRMADEIVDAISENSGLPKKKLMDDMGLEME